MEDKLFGGAVNDVKEENAERDGRGVVHEVGESIRSDVRMRALSEKSSEEAVEGWYWDGENR